MTDDVKALNIAELERRYAAEVEATEREHAATMRDVHRKYQDALWLLRKLLNSNQA